jgi:hypothetical protein
MESMPIYLVSGGKVGLFAARELRKYLARMTGASFDIARRRRHDAGASGLWLGLLADFGAEPRPGADPKWDDNILIEAGPIGGILAGSNPRSLLLAVYRYLTELGCRWLRPGKKGEYLPPLDGPLPEVRVREQASYRHRGVCIEGAVSWEHVRDTVDWLPKLGYNAYFLQFREAYNFFQRWYAHEANPLLPPKPFTVDDARALTTRVRAEVKKRGLLLHMVGHGWTCEPFGIPGPGWFQHEGQIPADAVRHLAQVNGERALWDGIALNTNLCYGNPDTRAIITGAIVEYAQANPDIDILHFWLADGCNNQCECDLCTPRRPADWYVMMLNELDAAMTAAAVATKIVFLAYVDLLWPPETERLQNPDRFILMFAPITRSYSTSFPAAERWTGGLPPYVRNKLEFPRHPGLNLAFLDAWGRVFSGDSFDFDYHLMWDHYYDPGYYAMARVLHQDIAGLGGLGLHGLMSCQVQRAFFPTGLPMTVMGRALWDRDAWFDDLAADYFASAFGERGDEARAYLQTISELFNPPLLRGEGTDEDRRRAARKLGKLAGVLRGAKGMIADGMALPDLAQSRSWKLLKSHADLCRLLGRALQKRWTGDDEEARRRAWKLVDWARRHERSLSPEFDVFEFLQIVVGGLLGIPGYELLSRE